MVDKKAKVECECGSIVTRQCLARHLKTKKHQEFEAETVEVLEEIIGEEDFDEKLVVEIPYIDWDLLIDTTICIRENIEGLIDLLQMAKQNN